MPGRRSKARRRTGGRPRRRIQEMSREGQSVPIGTAIFRVHADEITGCGAGSSAAPPKSVAAVRRSSARGASLAAPRRKR